MMPSSHIATIAGRPPRTAGRTGRAAREGMVLILVIVVVAALSLGALAFAELMVNRRELVEVVQRQVQARLLAESGIEAAKLLLAEEPDIGTSEEDAWYLDESRLHGILVIDDGTANDRGRFSVVAPASDREDDIRFGLECESARLNINTLLDDEDDPTAARERLMGLPDMTEDIADAILDWLDEDDEAREFGAEAQYYQSLASPYQPTNGPLRRIEELLHVRGVTRELLLGADTNRNGIVDANEAGQSTLTDERGWAAYLTLHSAERIQRADGQAKINVNQDDLETLHAELKEALGTQWATFIVGYRQQEELYNDTNQEGNNDTGGPNRPEDGGQPGSNEEEEIEYEDEITGELDLSKSASQTLDSVLDLIGQSIKVQYAGRENPVVVSPQFADDANAMADYLPKLLDCLTIDDATSASGRVNIHLASEAVLTCVPGIDADLAAQIVAQRPADPTGIDTSQQNLAWLLTEGLVPLDEAKALLPRLTVGGCVYRLQAVGFFDAGGPIVRLEAIMDATTTPARVLSLKDLSAFGRGFDPAMLGAAE